MEVLNDSFVKSYFIKHIRPGRKVLYEIQAFLIVFFPSMPQIWKLVINYGKTLIIKPHIGLKKVSLNSGVFSLPSWGVKLSWGVEKTRKKNQKRTVNMKSQ